MVDVKIPYEMALKLVLYMEEEIARLKRDYTELTHKYNELLLIIQIFKQEEEA